MCQRAVVAENCLVQCVASIIVGNVDAFTVHSAVVRRLLI